MAKKVRVSKVHELHVRIHEHKDLVEEIKKYFKRNEYFLLALGVTFSLLSLLTLLFILSKCL